MAWLRTRAMDLALVGGPAAEELLGEGDGDRRAGRFGAAKYGVSQPYGSAEADRNGLEVQGGRQVRAIRAPPASTIPGTVRRARQRLAGGWSR
jgi:hypothetical protein